MFLTLIAVTGWDRYQRFITNEKPCKYRGGSCQQKILSCFSERLRSMTPRLPRVNGKDVMKALLKAGFRELHTRGSHHYLDPAQGSKLVTVPVHGTKTLKPKTLKGILEQADLSVDELISLL